MEFGENPLAALQKKQETVLAKVEKYTLKTLYYGLVPAIICFGIILCIKSRLTETTKEPIGRQSPGLLLLLLISILNRNHIIFMPIRTSSSSPSSITA